MIDSCPIRYDQVSGRKEFGVPSHSHPNKEALLYWGKVISISHKLLCGVVVSVYSDSVLYISDFSVGRDGRCKNKMQIQMS